MTVQISGTVGMQLPSTGGGIDEEVDPLALKAANNLSDLNDAPTALENIGAVDSNGYLEAFDARNLTNVPQVDPSRRVVGTGLYGGGHVTINADDTKFDLSAGRAVFSDQYSDPDDAPSELVIWTAQTAIDADLLAGRLTYVGIRRDNVAPSGGTSTAITVTINNVPAQTVYLVQSPVEYTPAEAREVVQIALLIHPGAIISQVQALPSLVIDATQTLRDLLYVLGTLNVTGNEASANGANLNIDVSAGTQLRAGSGYGDSEAARKSINFSNQEARSPATFQYLYRDGGGGYTNGADTTTIVPGLYDDGDGTLAVVSANRWSIQRIWCFTSGNVRITPGQFTYGSSTAALAALASEAHEYDPTLDSGALTTFLIVRGGATDLSDSGDALFRVASRFGVGGGTIAPTAASTAYTVDDAGDWSVEPTTVKAGLDELAARRYVTDGGTDGQVLTSDGANGYTWEDSAGGGGLAVSSQTVSTGNITSGNSADVNFATPAGFTSVSVMSIEVTRTAGTGESFTIEAFLDDARSASAGYMMGGSFDSLSIGADTEYGPRIVISGSPQYLAIPYVNTDGSEFVRTTFTNNGGADGTFDVTLRMLPIN